MGKGGGGRLGGGWGRGAKGASQFNGEESGIVNKKSQRLFFLDRCESTWVQHSPPQKGWGKKVCKGRDWSGEGGGGGGALSALSSNCVPRSGSNGHGTD